MTDPDLDPRTVLERVSEQAVELVGAADGAMVGLLDGDELVCVAMTGTLVAYAGVRLRQDKSLSGEAINCGETLRCRNSETDPRVDRDLTRRMGVRSIIAAPIRQGDRRVGVLMVTAGVIEAFDGRDVSSTTRLADFIGSMVATSDELGALLATPIPPRTDEAGAHDGGGEPSEATGIPLPMTGRRLTATPGPPPTPSASADGPPSYPALGGILDQRDSFTMVVQPIRELLEGSLVGAEALARFAPPPTWPPDRWFAAGHRAGIGIDLELAAIVEALRHLDELPEGIYLSVNAGPDVLASGALAQAVEASDAGRIVLELTEHDAVHDYDLLRRHVQALRRLGARLAVDDAGTGVSSLSHILRLAPDLIKLDRSLVAGVGRDPVRRSLVTAMVAFAADTGAAIVAEGIETHDELRELRSLGVGHGQGFLLGRPGPPSALTRHLPEAADQPD
jgi:EAL domain-containing protein (putative c-di-GMP-specific phosphodiesterase class I)/putative methionine-R-sulfoxide reductase with GAF domain